MWIGYSYNSDHNYCQSNDDCFSGFGERINDESEAGTCQTFYHMRTRGFSFNGSTISREITFNDGKRTLVSHFDKTATKVSQSLPAKKRDETPKGQ